MSRGAGRNEYVGSRATKFSETPSAGPLENSRSTMDEPRGTIARRDQSSPLTKRMKRGKYISRACTACQQRKIKCEGGHPCSHCKARGRVCVSAVKGQSTQAPKISVGTTRAAEGSTVSPSSQELVVRVMQLERRMDMMQQPAKRHIESTHGRSLREPGPLVPTHDKDSQSSVSTQLQRILEPDGQSFMGEFSMTSGLVEVDGSVSEESTESIVQLAADIPPDKPLEKNTSSWRVRGWLERILERYGVVADKEEWRRYLELFFEEIHILYPVLHPPSVWEIFNGLWEYGALWPMEDSTEREEKRLSVALVCFCLALGRCCVSTRMTDSTGVHSSGWSICSVGMELLEESERTSKTGATSLLGLQILVLRICYWFRLDATQESARLVALAVSNAHIMGIHRQNRLDNVPCFQSQLLARVWWCIFVLDRRMAIESGRPFLIQENNTDTALPLYLSDEWLGRFAGRADTTKALEHEIETELLKKTSTAIPYLIAMVRYSRVVGKAWELIYGVKSTSNQAVVHLVDYADTVLSNLLKTLPEELSYNPELPEIQFGNRKRWQVKQTMLLSTCVTFLRIVIRRPFAPGKRAAYSTDENQLETLTTCASLASNILSAHKDLNDSNMKYCFPYCHYLTSCTMVMTSLVANEPALRKRHSEAILAATRSLRLYCHTIWVSGKMMRWVSKLTLLARRILQVEQCQRDEQPRGVSDVPHAQDTKATEETRPQQRLTQPVTQKVSQNSVPNTERVNANASSYYGSTHSERAPKPQGGREDQGMFHMWIPDGPGAENGLTELPGWVMSDFNFETISGDVFGPGNANFKNTAGTSDEMEDNGMSLGMSMGEIMLDTIPNGMYNLEMNLD